MSAEEIIYFVEQRDLDNLNKVSGGIPGRMIIEELKNRPDDLEFFFSWFSKWCNYLPGSGSYHYTNITSNRTLDIYHKYDFGGCNLHKEDVTEDQWDYMLKIGYITKEEYDLGSA